MASNRRQVLQCAFAALNTYLIELDLESEDDELLLQATLGLLKKYRSRVRKRVRKGKRFVENVVPLYSDLDFKRHFHLCKSTAETLSQQLAPKLPGKQHVDQPGRYPVDIKKQVLCSLWVLANQESFREVGDRFGITRSVAWKYLNVFVEAVLELNSEEEIISWPRGARAEKTMGHFEQKWRFPGVLGAIDGKHVAIKAPEDNPASYINRRGSHSIVLQAVCDEKMLFTDCYVGEVGSVHKACVLRRSPLIDMLQEASAFPNNSHVLGDAAYPLHEHLLTPYKDNRHLNEDQKTYNTAHSNCRSVIERAFAHLVERFRRLKYLDMSRIDLMVKLVVACCVLHNICIFSNDEAELDECPHDDNENMHSGDDELIPANAKRNDVANLITFRRLAAQSYPTYTAGVTSGGGQGGRLWRGDLNPL